VEEEEHRRRAEGGKDAPGLKRGRQRLERLLTRPQMVVAEDKKRGTESGRAGMDVLQRENVMQLSEEGHHTSHGTERGP